MSLLAVITTQVAVIVFIVAVLSASTATWFYVRKCWTDRLRNQVGASEHGRATKKVNTWLEAEANLDKPA
jgi:hypothetical protein